MKNVSGAGFVAALVLTAGMAYGQCPNYFIQQGSGTIEPGFNDIGNHGDDQTVAVFLPFDFTFYGQTYNALNVCSNGWASFTSANTAYSNGCLPQMAAPAFNSVPGPTLYVHWDDLRTDLSAPGIFSSESGTAPNRVFNLEWQAVYYAEDTVQLNFQLRLHENGTIEYVYGNIPNNGASATIGVQDGNGNFTQHTCNATSSLSGTKLTIYCPASPPPTGTGASSPSPIWPGESSLLTVATTPGSNPTSTNMTVTADLSAIGGSSAQAFFDNGTNGDITAGDGVFSFNATATISGSHGLPFTVADEQSRSSTGSIGLVVRSLTNLNALPSGVNNLDPVDLNAGQVRWYRFTIPSVDDANQRWLDISTTGGSDTELGLYRPDGSVVAFDDDDGDGLLTALSFGLDSPPRPAIGTGVEFNGRDGDLAAGEYYLALGTFNTTFNATAFDVTSTGAAGFGIGITTDLGSLTPRGTCCVAGACSVQTQADCGSMGGTYGGDGTTCGVGTYSIVTTPEQLSSIAFTGNMAFTASNCDDCTEVVALPFPFTHYGVTYNELRVSSNGNLQFGAAASAAYTNDAIPSSAVPNNAIYPLWDDYNPGEQGDIYYQEDGTAPARKFIVEWNNVTQFTAGGLWPLTSETFQVILHEGSNNVEFRYGPITPVNTSGIDQGFGQDASGGDRTIGVENAGGTAAVSHPSATHNGESLMVTFNPPPSPCGPVCATSDYDGDGDSGTDADIEAFFACLAGNCCATCWHLGSDINADGDSGTDADIEAFFRILAGNAC
jgi:hypothetical protein